MIDADLRCPAVGRLVPVRPEAGLSYALLNGMHWREQLTRNVGVPDLDVLGAGAPSRMAADLVGERLHELLEDARQEYSLIVIDAPPLLGLPEPLQMANAVDGVLLVALAGSTHMQALDSAVATLRRIQANIIGLVLNEVDRKFWYYGGYQGNYGDRRA